MRALVCVSTNPWETTAPLRRAGVEVDLIAPPRELSVPRLRWALRILRRDMREFDVVISQGGGLIGLMVTLNAIGAGCRTAIILRGNPWQEYADQAGRGGKSWLKATFDAWAARRNADLSDLILPLSETLRGWVLEEIAIDPGKLITVPLAVDYERLRNAGGSEPPPQWRHEHLISLATMFTFKQKIAGLERFLPLLRAIVEHYDACVVIAGEGPLREQFMRENRAVLDHPNIHLPGYVSDMPSLYHWSDFFCHFSLLDVMPKVPLEAWCCGLPVVVNDYAPLTEHVVSGVNGYVLPGEGTLDDWLPVVERLLTDPEHRRTLGENGRRLVEERFTPEAVGAQLRGVLEGR